MNLLLDTHVLLWALLEPQKLSPALRNALEDSDNTLVVSAASAWEIATKWRLGQLQQASAQLQQPHGDIAQGRAEEKHGVKPIGQLGEAKHQAGPGGYPGQRQQQGMQASWCPRGLAEGTDFAGAMGHGLQPIDTRG